MSGRFAADSLLEGTGFEPSVPLMRKALLGVANRRPRHERRSHLQVQVRDGDACLEWFPIASPFAVGPRVRIRFPPPKSQRTFSPLQLRSSCSCSGSVAAFLTRKRSGIPMAPGPLFGAGMRGQRRPRQPCAGKGRRAHRPADMLAVWQSDAQPYEAGGSSKVLFRACAQRLGRGW